MRSRRAGTKVAIAMFIASIVGAASGGAEAEDLPPDDGAPPEEHPLEVQQRLEQVTAGEVAEFAVEDLATRPPADDAFPIANATRSSCTDSFGDPRSGGRSHQGVDCFAALGTPLVATEPGTIRYATAGGAYSCTTGGDISGNRVSLRGRSGFVYYYGHLNTIDVAAGQYVEKGQIIGTVGRTGNAACSSPHLHIEVKCGDDGLPFDPFPWMAPWQRIRSPFSAPYRTVTVTQLRLPPPPCAWPVETAVHLRSTATAGAPDVSFDYGMNTYLHLLCDFDGDGRDGIVVFDRGMWHVRSTASAGPPDLTFQYGAPGYIPVCGDWDGDGDDGIGVYVEGSWYLRFDATPGAPQVAFDYGIPGYIPVVGDWDGVGPDGVGVYVAGQWYLRQLASPGCADVSFSYGTADYEPVTGDWNGDGVDGTGVYIEGGWYLREVASPGAAQRVYSYGTGSYWPVVGDFDGDGRDGSGVVAP